MRFVRMKRNGERNVPGCSSSLIYDRASDLPDRFGRGNALVTGSQVFPRCWLLRNSTSFLLRKKTGTRTVLAENSNSEEKPNRALMGHKGISPAKPGAVPYGHVESGGLLPERRYGYAAQN